MTRSLLHARPAVAAHTAARLLNEVDDPAIRAVGCEIDWAGPVALPLASERAVQAACGIMHVHGRAAGRPAPLAVDYASATAGVLAAHGVLAVLVARSRGLAVDEVRTSVSQAALCALAQHLAASTADDPQEPHVPGHPVLTSADGVRFEFETLDPHRWLDFWKRLGANAADVGRGWGPFQQRFATATCPLPAALHETAQGTPFLVIREAADSAGASVLPVREEPDPPVVPRPWTYSPFPQRSPERTGGIGPAGRRPLDGVRVVEATRRVQGPMAGHILQLLGADVVRIEPPGGDPMRGVPPIAGACSARFTALNRGKSVVAADLASEAGRHTVRELVAGADVFVHNWRPGKAAQLRLDADDLRGVRPGLVYAWASGWGDAVGPSPPVGTDFLVQAHSGLAAALRPADEPPAPSLMTLTDVLGGLVCAQGVLAALLARVRTGHGGRVDSSLFSAATVLPRPRRRAVWGPFDRPVRTADGYLSLGVDVHARAERVAEVVGLSAATGPAALTSRFREWPTEVLLPRLREAGVTATPVCTDLRELAGDPRFGRALSAGDPVCPLAPWEFR